MNVVFQWDADAEDWTPLNTGTSEDPVPGMTNLESVEAGFHRDEDYLESLTIMTILARIFPGDMSLLKGTTSDYSHR